MIHIVFKRCDVRNIQENAHNAIVVQDLSTDQGLLMPWYTFYYVMLEIFKQCWYQSGHLFVAIL